MGNECSNNQEEPEAQPSKGRPRNSSQLWGMNGPITRKSLKHNPQRGGLGTPPSYGEWMDQYNKEEPEAQPSKGRPRNSSQLWAMGNERPNNQEEPEAQPSKGRPRNFSRLWGMNGPITRKSRKHNPQRGGLGTPPSYGEWMRKSLKRIPPRGGLGTPPSYEAWMAQ